MAGLAWFLALVLATSSLQKLLERDRMSMATARLTGLNAALALPVLLVAAAVEAMAALTLVFPQTQGLGAVLAGGLWLGYGAALLAAARRGDSLDCGCSFTARTKPVDSFMIARAFGLAILAGVALAAALAAALAGTTAPGIEPVFAALGLFALYNAAGEIAALPPLRRKAAR